MTEILLEQQKASPDAYTRHYIVAEVIGQIFSSKKIDLLDVGGAGTYLEFFTGKKSPIGAVTIIDILPPPEKMTGIIYVQGDATAMAFTDNQFDAVVSTDVYEHIHDNGKTKFLTECLRVAKDLVVIGAPFESAEVTRAETLANNYYRHNSGKPHAWLKEHFELNKPRHEKVEAILAKEGYSFLKFSSNQIDNWLQSIFLNFMAETKAVDRSVIEPANQFYNAHFAEMNDFQEPGYRTFYIIFKNRKLRRSLSDFFPIKNSHLSKLDFQAQVLADLGGEAKRLTGVKADLETQVSGLEADAVEERELVEKVNSFINQVCDKIATIKSLDVELADLRRRRWFRWYVFFGGRS